MTVFNRKIAKLCCLTAALLVLSGCGGKPEPTRPTQPPVITLPTAPVTEPAEETVDPALLVEELTAVMEAGQLYTLGHYPNLKTADLSGSTCYDAILAYQQSHPALDITYDVDMGGTRISSKAAEATLQPGEFTYDVLLENLQYLPGLSAISLPDIPLDAAQAATLRERYPGIALNYTVELLGSSYPSGTQELDLSGMESAQIDEALPKLGLLTELTSVKLSHRLSLEDVARLQDANPNADFLYTFSLFGKTISTADETVEYKNQNIGNEGEEQIRQALEVLDSCTRFVLDNCKLDYEVLAGIREDFREKTKVVWRVYFGVNNRYNYLTDAETIRTVKNVTDDTCGPLKYCEDVKYMDMGHNDYLTDLSFLPYMTKLEVLIASGSAVKVLPDLSACKNLTWLELANCLKLTDIEGVAGCESLRFLNLSFTRVTNLMACDGLPLERFVYLRPHASAKEQNTFKEIHPDCITVFYGYTNPYGYGWRYDDNGKTMFSYYKDVVRVVFNYDYVDSILPDDE